MTVRVYRSSDASAPVLRGNTAGDLINVLDKCLVAGYGSKTAAGWTKPYTGTNIAVFRNGAGSTGAYLRVDDTSTAASNRAARVVGYEAMSDVNTGTPNSFPTNAQLSGGGYWWTKFSSSTAANAREWMIVATEKVFYMWIDTYPEQATQEYNNEFYGFGDIQSWKTGDATHCFLLCSTSTSAPSTSEQKMQNASIGSATPGLYMARRFDQLGGPVPMGWQSDSGKQSTYMCSGQFSYPHGPDGALLLAPVYCLDPNSSPYNVRGIFPGLWAHPHASTILAHLDTFNGQGDLTGKTFISLRLGASSGVIIETSDTWG